MAAFEGRDAPPIEASANESAEKSRLAVGAARKAAKAARQEERLRKGVDPAEAASQKARALAERSSAGGVLAMGDPELANRRTALLAAAAILGAGASEEQLVAQAERLIVWIAAPKA